MAQAARPDHDALYHRLFSHPGLVAQLLRDFVGGTWLAELDLEGMERLNTKFHADIGQRREGDMIWRIPRRDGDRNYRRDGDGSYRRDGEDSYLVLLLEFQSTSDHYMAVRVLTYAGLLWQQLVREQRLPAHGRLPPILPVVLYNGDARWRAPVALRALVALPETSPVWRWQPDLRYILIDASAFSEPELAARDGLPALWFRLESASDPVQVVAVADAMLAWFARHPGFAAARAVVAELLGTMMAPLGPALRVPEDLLEVRNMLATRAEEWKQAWLREGRQEGLHEGRQEGRQEGEAKLLLRLLERRFGALPHQVTDRVRAAEISVLEEWGMRILDAGSLEDVFAERPA
jgi:hypothetical protein